MRKYIFLFALFLAVLPFRLYHINYPLLDATNFRQAQTSTIALNFYKNGINLLQTELDIFGIGKERYLTLEFPIYEAIVALLYKLFFVSEVWGRVVSILAGFIGAFYLYKLTNLLVNRKLVAFLSSFFFLFAPLNMLYHRDFMMETTVVALLVSGLFYFCQWVKTQDHKSYFLSIILLSLGFMQKGVYGPFWLLPMLIYYLQKKGFKNTFNIKFIIIFLIPLVSLFLWQQHVNYVNTLNGHEYFTTTNVGHLEWNFGTLADRFSWSVWQPRLSYLQNGIFLKPGLIIFAIGLIAAFKLSNKGFLFAWLVSQVIYFLTFFRIQSHNYYQMVIIPIASIFMSLGLVKLSYWISKVLRFIPLKSTKVGINRLVIIAFCIFFVYRSWLHARWDYQIDTKWRERFNMVKQAIKNKNYGIFVTPGYDWNSIYTYYTKKKMMVVGAEDVSVENIGKWKGLGYDFLILHEYEKYPDYLSQKKPGHFLDFLRDYKLVLKLEDFEVYFL